MKILVYGSINIDSVYSVDHIALPGETIKATGLSISAGGKGANQAAALAKAGSDVWFAGKAGESADWIVKLLESFNVHTEYLCRTATPNGQAIIQLDRKRQNSIIILPGANGEIERTEIDSVLEHFGDGDCLVLQNEIPHIGYLIEKAAERGMRIVFNPSPIPTDIAALPLEKVSILVVNEIEGAAIAGLGPDSDYREILSVLEVKYPSTETVMTLGAQGALYRFQGNEFFASGVKVKAVDTTGAGDTFLGYFLTYKNEGRSMENCLADACMAAGLAVSRPGAMQSIPLRSEVEAH